MKNVLKTVKWLLPISGLLVVALGIIMFFVTLEELSNWAIFVGIAMILSGITDLVSFKRKEKEKRNNIMLASGSIAILLGLYTVFGRGLGLVEFALPLIFAVWIGSASISRIKDALAKKKNGHPLWVFMFSFGVLGILLGVLLIFNEMLSTFIVTYALATMFITHGINTIMLFIPVELKIKSKTEVEK